VRQIFEDTISMVKLADEAGFRRRVVSPNITFPNYFDLPVAR